MPIPMTDGSSALKRGLLRDDVYTRLRDAIVDGTFAPGEQLRDLDLAQWLGVSRTPVREALMRLDPLWEELFPAEQARIVQLLVERIDISTAGLKFTFRNKGLVQMVTETSTLAGSGPKAAAA